MMGMETLKERVSQKLEEMLARRFTCWYLQATREKKLSEECPDLQLLAAFVEQNLLPEQKLLVEEHIADCWRCRKLVVMVFKVQKVVPDPIPPKPHNS
jgi:hypothetical protein